MRIQIIKDPEYKGYFLYKDDFLQDYYYTLWGARRGMKKFIKMYKKGMEKEVVESVILK